MCECNKLGVDEQIEKFDAVLEKYKGDRTNVMVVLQETQEIHVQQIQVQDVLVIYNLLKKLLQCSQILIHLVQIGLN